MISSGSFNYTSENLGIPLVIVFKCHVYCSKLSSIQPQNIFDVRLLDWQHSMLLGLSLRCLLCCLLSELLLGRGGFLPIIIHWIICRRCCWIVVIWISLIRVSRLLLMLSVILLAHIKNLLIKIYGCQRKLSFNKHLFMRRFFI